MSWVTVTDQDILPANSKERIAIVAVKGIDDLPDSVQKVTDSFRGAISARGFELGPDGTIPSSLVRHVQAMALWTFLTQGVPKNESVQTEARKKADSEGASALKAIYEGRMAIEAVSTPANPRGGQWNSENKLIPRGHPTPSPSVQYQNTNPAVEPYANPNAPSDN